MSVFGSGGGDSGARLHPGYRSGAYYSTPVSGTPATTSAMTADTVYLFPISLIRGGTFSGMAIRVGTAVPATNGKLALYDNAGGIEGTKRLIEACSATVDMNETALSTLTTNFAANRFIPAGFYWAASIFNGAAQPGALVQSQVYGAGLAPILGGSNLGAFQNVSSATAIRFTVAGETYAGGFPATLGAPSVAVTTPGSPILALVAA